VRINVVSLGDHLQVKSEGRLGVDPTSTEVPREAI
jgi:hypothetical protein